MSHPAATGTKVGECLVEGPLMNAWGVQVNSPEIPPSPPMQPPKVTSFSLLGDLPVELVYQVIRHMTDKTKLFLSLTNKTFRNYVGEIHLVSRQKLEFLQLLLRNYPTLMLCRDCLNLHTRDVWLDHPFDNPHWAEPKSFCSQQRYLFSYGVAMSFVQIQLVMDRHLTSSAHSVPLSALVIPPQFRFRKPQKPEINHCEMETEPRIVNDELIIKGHLTEWREDGDMAAFVAAVTGWTGLRPHVACGEPPLMEPDGLDPSPDCPGIERELPDLASFDFNDFASPSLVGEVRGCPFCCTDYQTAVSNCSSERRGWRVEWSALVDEWQLHKKNPEIGVEHEAGSIRSAFESAERQVPLEILECEEPDWNAPDEFVWHKVETEKAVGTWEWDVSVES